MALNIRNSETERLAAELAELTGETKTEAVTQALRARLEVVRKKSGKRQIARRLDEIAQHCASLPVLNKHASEAMLYDEHGLPK